MSAMGDNDRDSYYDAGLMDVHAAILSDDYDKLLNVCESGLDLNIKFTAEVNPNHAGMTPLALASALNKYDLVEVLLDNGGDPNSTFASLKTTALMTSAFHGHVDIVRLLLESGANVRAVDLQQSTALGYCFGGTRNLEVVNLLLAAGVDVNQKNMLGMNALLLVSGYGNDHLVKTILDAGANPNATNDFGHTALHLAVVGKRDQIKKMKKMGFPEAIEADKSLNRRNLDGLMQEWARRHQGPAGATPDTQEALGNCGQFMMSIGQKLEEDHTGDDDDQEALKRRIEAVWKYRQAKMKESREKKKPAIMGLLNCGGGKSKAAKKAGGGAKPYVPPNPSEVSPHGKNDEISKLSDKCTRIISMLIEAGCEIDQTEKTFGMTALDMAILNGDVESAALLVSTGGDNDHLMKMFASSDLYEALVGMDRKELKELLNFDEDLDVNQPFLRFNITRKGGVDPNTPDEMSDEGLTPLTVAVKTNDFELVRLLIKKGANINKMGPGGKSPLSEAAGRGNLRMMQVLLNERADVEQACPGYKNATPVIVAAMMQQHRAVDMLIKRGAKVDKRQSDGRTSLVKAMETRDEHMMDLLLNADLHINYIDQHAFMYEMATRYQSKDRDVEAIVSAISDHCQEIIDNEERERAKNAQREQANRVTPNRGPPPQQRGRGPPQNQRPPEPHRQQRPHHNRQPHPESSFAIEDQPSRQDVVIVRQEQPASVSLPPEPEHYPPVPPRQEDDEEDAYRPVATTVVTTTRVVQPEVIHEPEESEGEPEYYPVRAQKPQQVEPQPVIQRAPQVVPNVPVTAPPAVPQDEEESEEETSEEEESEEEETSEEESEEETDEEEEEEDVPPPPPLSSPPALSAEQSMIYDTPKPAQQSRTVVTTVRQPGGQTVTQRTVVTKTVVTGASQPQVVEDDEEESEEESEEETEEETDSEEESSEEEETDSDEEEEEEEVQPPPRAAVARQPQDINRNVQKTQKTTTTRVVTRTVNMNPAPHSTSNETEI